MVKSFFIVAFRNLRRNSLYSVINIAGLSVGIVCSVLILLWVQDETSYDSFLPKYEKICQVWVNAEFDGKINSWRSVPLPTYEAMKTAHSDIVNSTVTTWGGSRLLQVGDKRLVKRLHFVSEEFLEMFEYPLVHGDPAQVLDDPSSIVLTESLAEMLFGEEDPLGKMVRFDDKSSLKVSGILKDIPGNSFFDFDYLVPWKHREMIEDWVVRNKTNWGNYSFQVFVELSDASKEPVAENGVKDMLTENGEEDIPRLFFLHPMPEWRLYSNFEDGKQIGGMSDYVQLFTLIAVFILFIACINFMNLATARSEKRAREVGIRKSLGSSRFQLIVQFITESVLLSFIAFVLAIIITSLVLPYYNTLVEKELVIDMSSPIFWAFASILIFGTGILSGSYPAFFLSSFSPVKTLKGSLSLGKGASIPRKVLVVFQFGVAILLMIGTVVIFQQINLAQNRALGYNQEHLISIQYNDHLEEHYDVFKNDLLQSGHVESVTRSNAPVTQIWSNNFLGWPGKPENLKVIFTTVAAGYDYTKTMGIKMVHGRDFSREFGTDTSSIVINQAALDLMGLEDPVGTSLDLWGDKKKLIGVMENVLMGSPYEADRPMFMVLDRDWIGVVTVRLKGGADLSGNLAGVQRIFEKHSPAYPFDYTFADEDFQKKFNTIELTRQLATIFAFLAVFITGLGLFGLAAYTTEQRIKEIGIRKVLGASVQSLVGLISKDFSRLVIVAFLIFAPLAWYFLDQYLDRYQVRIDIEWYIFPMVGLAALGFALLIVGNQAWRAALVNPSKSLRNE